MGAWHPRCRDKLAPPNSGIAPCSEPSRFPPWRGGSSVKPSQLGRIYRELRYPTGEGLAHPAPDRIVALLSEQPKSGDCTEQKNSHDDRLNCDDYPFEASQSFPA